MKLVIFGAGYVGLVTGAGLSDLGHEVLILDTSEERVQQLLGGACPIHEPGLGDLMKRNVRAGRLHFAAVGQLATSDADAYFIAVGTPPLNDGSADTSQVLACAERIACVAKKPALVVVKSTVPVGTCDAVQERLDVGRQLPRGFEDLPLEAVSNPEFLKEGDALNDFFKPDRVVVGARSERARDVMRKLYAPLNLSGERPLLFTSLRSAELTKYAANAMLAMRISFMNEVARLCYATKADVHEVRLGIGSDSRIGKKFLYPGPGYGGSCFPKDVRALVAMGAKHDLAMRLASAAHAVNEEQAHFVAAVVEDALGDLRGKVVALWGLAFKPETDDVRESPALKLARTLISDGAVVVGHDPEAGENFKRAVWQATFADAGWKAWKPTFSVEADRVAYEGIAKRLSAEIRGAVLKDGTIVAEDALRVVDNDLDALDGAHVLVLLTEWRCYRAPDWAEVARRMRPGATVVDARNIWRREDVVRAGLRYRGIGVPSGGPTQ